MHGHGVPNLLQIGKCSMITQMDRDVGVSGRFRDALKSLLKSTGENKIMRQLGWFILTSLPRANDPCMSTALAFEQVENFLPIRMCFTY